MRWADWFVCQGSLSPRRARRKIRLAVHPLEERTVPHGTGAEHMEHPTEPPPTDVAVVKEETPPAPTDAGVVKAETPPTPVDNTIIHLDDVVVKPGDGTVASPTNDKVSPEAPAVDDSAARTDWGFAPQYNFERGFSEYLIPMIRQRYQ